MEDANGDGPFRIWARVVIMSSGTHLRRQHPHSMTSPTARQALIWLLAPTLLVAVVGTHAYLVVAKNQTPWEGGGFGMFSTVDKRQARFVRGSLITEEGEAIRVRMPSHLSTYLARMRARPTELRARRLADFLAAAEWVETDSSEWATVEPGSDDLAGRYRYRPPHEATDRPRAEVDSVRIEIWRYRFESRPYRLEAEPLVQITEERASEAQS